MAFLDDDNDEINPLAQSQAQGPLVGGGSNAAGNSVSQAGVGAGGTGGWTNIQAYLNANKGDTGSAQALTSEVGSQFGKEREAFEGDSNKFLQDAGNQLNQSKVTTGQADDMIKQGSADYDWGGQQKSSYTDNVNKIQGFLTGEYSGPKSYSYGFDAKTQNYGNAVKGGEGFDSVMNDLYSKRSNSPLTSGQYQLQKQLDVNNQNLVDARQNLSGAYDQLGKDRDATVKNTTEKLGGYEQDYRTSQNALNDFLGNQMGSYDTKIAQAEGAAKTEYDKLFNEGQTGNASVGWDSPIGIQGTNATARANLGILGDNLTWKQLEKENTAITPNRITNDPNQVSWFDWQQGSNATQNELDRRRGQLNQFYGEQDAKYANVGDADERAYNTILDFLNSSGERKKQGFRVRG